MATTLLKKLQKQSAREVRRELARAHLIIAMLSIALIALLSFGSVQAISFDARLSAICVILLSLVTVASLCISFTLYKCKK